MKLRMHLHAGTALTTVCEALEQSGWTVEVGLAAPPSLPAWSEAVGGSTGVANVLSGELPHAHLLAVLARIRAQGSAPVLILAGPQTDLFGLLQAGATDFVMPPYPAQEIDTRLRVRSELPSVLSLGECEVELGAHQVRWPKSVISLTGMETRLLAHLWRHADRAISREALLTAVWGYLRPIDTRAVALTVSRLRKKIEVDPAQPKHVVTVYGVGYRLVLRPRFRPQEAAPPGLFSLPTPTSSLVGREDVVQEILQALTTGQRLLALHGPGGIGKTRLALEAGRQVMGAEVFYVDAAEAQTEVALAHTLTRCLGLPAAEGPLQLERLERALVGRSLLLIVDHVDRCIAGATPLLDLLASVSGLRTLLASRIQVAHPLALTLSIPPLPIEDGTRLFVARAREVSPGFALAETEHPVVREIVLRLDGLPLAIELAASRVLLLSPAQLLRRLGRRFELLGSTVLKEGRHHSLVRTLDDSWALLSRTLQDALAACAVFRGGFTIDDAEAVLPVDRLPVLDRIHQLVQHSFIQLAPAPGGPRCSLFETVQCYLEDKAGVDEARQRHLVHFLSVAHQLSQDIVGPDPIEAHSRFQQDRPNLLAAIASACRTAPELAAALVLDLCQLYWMEGDPGMLELLDAVPEDISRARRRRIQVQRARFLVRQASLQESRRLLEEVLVACELEQDLECRCDALQLLATIEVDEGDATAALSRAPEVEPFLIQTGQRRILAVHLTRVAGCHRLMGRLQESRSTLHAALQIEKEEGALWNEIITRGHLSLVHHQLGEIEEAEAVLRPQLEFLQQTGDRRSALVSRLNLATFLVDGGELLRAEAELREVESYVDRFGTDLERAFFTCLHARIALDRGQWDVSQRHIDEVLTPFGGRRARVISHVWTLRVWLEQSTGKIDAALQTLERARTALPLPAGGPDAGRLLLRDATLQADRGEQTLAVSRWMAARAMLLPSEMPSVVGLVGAAARHILARDQSLSMRHAPGADLRTWADAVLEAPLLGIVGTSAELRWALRLVPAPAIPDALDTTLIQP